MKQGSVIETSGLRPLTDDQLNAVNGGAGPVDGVRLGPVDGVRLGPVDGVRLGPVDGIIIDF